jgi:hypothetical protein
MLRTLGARKQEQFSIAVPSVSTQRQSLTSWAASGWTVTTSASAKAAMSPLAPLERAFFIELSLHEDLFRIR